MRGRQGFTLIEVIVALVILLLVISGLATSTGRFVRTVAENDFEATAVQLAQDRIQEIQMDPDYGGLETSYVGVESSFPTLTGFTRQTEITRVGGPGQPTDYKKITVTVNGPGLGAPVARTTTVGAP